MTEKEILNILTGAGALLEGHFQLRSGLHSDRFFQAALVLQFPEKAEKLCSRLASFFKDEKIDTVLSPAVGGLVVGQEIAKFAKSRAIFAEKENDNLVLRRGFALSKGEKVLIAEDVVTKGGRVSQCVELARSFGADVRGIAVIADRSGGIEFDVPFRSLVKLNLATYEPDKCPLCSGGVPLVKPGSK